MNDASIAVEMWEEASPVIGEQRSLMRRSSMPLLIGGSRAVKIAGDNYQRWKKIGRRQSGLALRRCTTFLQRVPALAEFISQRERNLPFVGTRKIILPLLFSPVTCIAVAEQLKVLASVKTVS